MNYRYFVLGLLARQPMSGYDIKGCFESFSWLAHSPSFGSLYPALHALLEDGYLTVEVIEGDSGLSRKVYTIAEAGRQALKKWIDESMEADTSLKTFLMYLMVAGNLSRDALLTHLKQRRSQVADYQTALKQVGEAAGNGEDPGEELAFDYGRVLAAAETAWLDRKLAQLCRPSCESAVGGTGSVHAIGEVAAGKMLIEDMATQQD